MKISSQTLKSHFLIRYQFNLVSNNTGTTDYVISNKQLVQNQTTFFVEKKCFREVRSLTFLPIEVLGISLHYIHTYKRFSNRIASLMMRGKKVCFMHTKSYYGWLNAKYANGKFLSKSLACCYCHARFILKVLWIWHFPTLINRNKILLIF